MKALLAPCLVLALLLVPYTSLNAADEGGLSDKEKTEFSKQMLLPSPAEIFVAFSKLGKADWNKAASYCPRYDYDTNQLRALNLGSRAADAFLAIQAKDKDRLAEMITVIITLAEELMVEQTILEKGRAFEDLARRDQWQTLHQELDTLRDAVVEEMKRLGDRDMALLVSAGGWLQGLRASATVLVDRYEPEASSVLYQPRLVDFFFKELRGMSPETQRSPAVRKLLAALPQIRALVDVGYKNPVPRQNIVQLRGIAEELVQTFEKG